MLVIRHLHGRAPSRLRLAGDDLPRGAGEVTNSDFAASYPVRSTFWQNARLARRNLCKPNSLKRDRLNSTYFFVGNRYTSASCPASELALVRL
jgi:hypothetical protein